MLVRDGRNQEALKALETRYRAGKREVDAVLHLYKLYMSFAEIEQATRIMQEFAADHGDDPAAVALLAKHYGDMQDKPAQIRTLEAAVRRCRRRCRPRASCWPTTAWKARSTARRPCCATPARQPDDRAQRCRAAGADVGGAAATSTARAKRSRVSTRSPIRNAASGASPCSTCWCKSATRPRPCTRRRRGSGYWRKASIHRTAGADSSLRSPRAHDDGGRRGDGEQTHLRGAANRTDRARRRRGGAGRLRAQRAAPHGRGGSPSAVPRATASRTTNSAAGDAGERGDRQPDRYPPGPARAVGVRAAPRPRVRAAVRRRRAGETGSRLRSFPDPIPIRSGFR